ncbi:Phytochrome-like protein cph1 [compost metagenome]
MIEGVLAYSAITSSERPIDVIDLNDVVDNIETDLEILIQKKHAKLQKGRLPVIEGASVLIYQLFYNLINNALKFAKLDNETLITIESTIIGANDKKMAKIIITDNGIGLDPDYVHKIFDVFSRLNAKDEYEGTGLGLALCKKIVQRHHGTIQATGVKGESASFILLLPVHQAQKII